MSLDQFYLYPTDKQEAILNGPALPPPAGLVSNFDNPPNQNVLAFVIITILLFIATSTVILAVYAKVFFIRKIYFEDSKVGYTYSMITGVGIFVHQWDVRVRDLAGLLYIVHIESEFYAVIVILFKTAILLEWVRIFVPRGTHGVFYWICHTVIWLNLVFYTAILIGGNISCKPYAKIWDKTVRGRCDNNDAFDVATAVYGFASDVIILLLPHRVIWRLQMKTKRKIGIAIIFTIGICACAATAYRLYASLRFWHLDDTVYGIGDLALATDAELVCAVLVYHVPMLPRAFKDSKGPFGFLLPLLSRNKDPSNSSHNQKDSLRKPTFQHQDYYYTPDGLSGQEYNPQMYPAIQPAHPGWVYLPQARTRHLAMDEQRGDEMRLQVPWHV
ncbi:hypothetical protein GGS20DRAFT_591748 [Poronia punctata]|nr:hypothetical protein GGS20DRAFT_591748 [Poronia punctata]